MRASLSSGAFHSQTLFLSQGILRALRKSQGVCFAFDTLGHFPQFQTLLYLQYLALLGITAMLLFSDVSITAGLLAIFPVLLRVYGIAL